MVDAAPFVWSEIPRPFFAASNSQIKTVKIPEKVVTLKVPTLAGLEKENYPKIYCLRLDSTNDLNWRKKLQNITTVIVPVSHCLKKFQMSRMKNLDENVSWI